MNKYIITTAFVLGLITSAFSQNQNTNYVKTTAYKTATQTGAVSNPDDKIESISYFDGLGRPTQSIQLKAGANKENIISFHRYDGYGREVKTYLPYATNGPVNSLDSIHDVTTDQASYYQNNYSDDFHSGIFNPFSEIELEDSPLNRPFKQAAPGSDWALGSGHEVKMDYQTNNSADDVVIFGVDFNNLNTATPTNNLGKYEPTLTYEGRYNTGELYKNIVKDENWTPSSGNNHTVEEFTNKSGQVVLKRTYESNQRHDTYYVYDDFGNLSFVIPPLASDQILKETYLIPSQAESRNMSWVNLVEVDREFADDFNRKLEEYDNGNILTADIENEYNGLGGLTVSTPANSDELNVNINFSVSQSLQLNTGYVMKLDELGEFKDTELGKIDGIGYGYSFSIQRNQLFIEGDGKLNALNLTLSSQSKLTHSLDIPWVDFMHVSKDELNKYYEDAKELGLDKTQMLTHNIPNVYGGLGGLNLSVDTNDNVSVNLNISFTQPLKLKTGVVATLKIKRRLKDRSITSFTSNGKNFEIVLKNNQLVLSGTEDPIDGLFTIATVADPVSSISIDTATLQGLCYIYEYDHRNRLVEKKIPGKDWEHIVYDALDRPILTQDGNQRAGVNMERQWLFTKYDKLGRVVYTGIYYSTLSRKQIQNESNNFKNLSHAHNPTDQELLYEKRDLPEIPFNNGNNNIYYTHRSFPNDTNKMDVLTVSYYDDPVKELVDGTDYTYDVGSGSDIANGMQYQQANTYNGQPAIQLTKEIIPGNSISFYDPKVTNIGLATISEIRTLGTTQWTNSATYYDDKARPVYAVSTNEYLGTTDRSWMELDFVGKTLAGTSTHRKLSASSATITVVDDFTYDHMDRLLTHTQQIDNQPQELIVNNKYDALGQLESKDVGGASTSNGLQTVDYDYNIRGWLTDINKMNGASLGNDLFSFSIGYNDPSQSGATALYNGNISETLWRTASDNKDRMYTYNYDALNRLNKATYTGSELLSQNVGNNIAGEQENYSLNKVSYDKNGNILLLHRMGLYKENAESFDYDAVDLVDKLTYQYSPKSNQLVDVSDAADNVNDEILNGGFKDTFIEGNNYSYDDLNGNMTADRNKQISEIIYNHLNLPTHIYFDFDGSITYTYDATGMKLSKTVNSANGTTSTYYAGNYIYEEDNNGEKLQFFSHPEGFVETTLDNGNYSYEYVYQYKDHLGNVRLNYAKGPNGLVIKEENNYYPFGLKHKGYNNVIVGRDHKFDYLNQEFHDDLGLNWHSFKWRFADPSIGRFFGSDPIAEEFYYQTNYQFASNNPIWKIELEGLEGEPVNDGTDLNDSDTAWYLNRVGNKKILTFGLHNIDFGIVERREASLAGPVATYGFNVGAAIYNSISLTWRGGMNGQTLTDQVADGVQGLGETVQRIENGEGTIQDAENLTAGGVTFAVARTLRISTTRSSTATSQTATVAQQVVAEAQRLNPNVNTTTLTPGPNASRSIPARSTSTRFTRAERSAINEIGETDGCHTCGSRNSGRASGNFTPDHQPPSALVPNGTSQMLYPQCLACSASQGGTVSGLVRRGYDPNFIGPVQQ